ncbi:hypothetical protein SLEP1_g29226 [Rubroshorea leprosula]|uniref:RING-type E3 ubiquitin transferase n=1 Tax=Rubroshorea leprosula TaxID=152421 RepID=A0AAV5K398_9ROSI|nr:hypothetical protein SLEP1_g29226 [Rubroshorea leprosula]
MIRRFAPTDRRILSFPAVHPCESISPDTLLSSLITLSHTICSYRSKFFAIQRRNAREMFRQIAILHVFFEEFQDRHIVPSESVVLCFSELHITFQKIQFLVEDCSREGGRLWVLMKSEFVVSQFRTLIRAIATALDVLPLDLIPVCNEVKELVELVAKQARKAKIDIDPNDENAMKQVRSILNQFEKGTEQEFEYFKLVLDHLQIKSWNFCNKEIKFLEEQIEFHFQSSGGEEREVPILSSLLGFMNYCRGVVFDTMDCRDDQTDVRCNTETVSCLNPEDFRCPISLELMSDPVTVSTGQTYDRSSIEKWLKAGNSLCPKTGEKLTNTELVPNTNLHRLIKQFCSGNGISLGEQTRDISRTTVPGSPAAAEAMKFLSEHLTRKLVFGSRDQKNKAAYEIRLLAKASIFNRYCVVEAGAVLPLLNLLHSLDKSNQENAIAALLKLSKHTTGRKEIVENCGLRSVLGVLNRGLTLEARQIAAATIFYLSSVKGYRKLIGETPEAIPGLIELIKEGNTCGKKNAVVAIFGLLLYPGNHSRVLETGTVPLMVDILSNYADNPEVVPDSLAVLAALAENVNGTSAILETSSALNLVPRILLCSTSRTAKEYCVSILLSLCEHGGKDVISVLAKEPSLMNSLYSLITGGTSHGSKKARSLIKILQEASCSRLTVSHDQPVYFW